MMKERIVSWLWLTEEIVNWLAITLGGICRLARDDCGL